MSGRQIDASEGDTAARSAAWSLHRFANPGRFLRLAQKVQPWLTTAAIILTVTGLTWGLFFAPADWQQGDAVRIMYVHVPSAWLASSGYFGLAICSLLSLVWRDVYKRQPYAPTPPVPCAEPRSVPHPG